MRAVVVYESMYGNTHRVADAIGRGLARRADVTVVPVAGAGPELVQGADLLVVGGPTHVRGMTRPSTRKAAVEQAKPADVIDPSASGPGVREWLEQADTLGMPAAAFDTRADIAPAAITGRASPSSCAGTTAARSSNPRASSWTRRTAWSRARRSGPRCGGRKSSPPSSRLKVDAAGADRPQEECIRNGGRAHELQRW